MEISNGVDSSEDEGHVAHGVLESWTLFPKKTKARLNPWNDDLIDHCK